MLGCLIQSLKTSLEILSGIGIKLDQAQGADNPDPELIASLECAQQNVLTSMGHLMQGFEPVQVILDLAGPFMSIAGVQTISLPALGSAEDIEAMTEVIATLEDVTNTIQQIVDTLGGCPE